MYGPRGTQVARVLGQLATLGWEPTAICMAPRRGGPHWPAGAGASELPQGVELVRVPSPEEWVAVRAAWRLAPRLRDFPDSTRVWVGRAVGAAVERARKKRFAGLVTFAQPWSDHLAGARIHAITGLPWVAHFSDPWSDSPYATPRQRSIWRAMEEAVIRSADAVIFVSEETADLVMAKYPHDWRAKASVVPHGFVADMAHPPARPEARSPLRLVYTGRFYDGVRTPIPLLRALSELHHRAPLTGAVEVLFVGPHVHHYARDADALGVAPLVRFRGRVPAAEAARIAAGADVLLVVDAPSDGPNVFLPSKLIEYLPLRKPIFGVTPLSGATASLLRRLECPVAPPDDVGAITSVLGGMIECWRAGQLRVGESFDRVAAEYHIARTAARLDDVLARAFGLSGPLRRS